MRRMYTEKQVKTLANEEIKKVIPSVSNLTVTKGTCTTSANAKVSITDKCITITGNFNIVNEGADIQDYQIVKINGLNAPYINNDVILIFNQSGSVLKGHFDSSNNAIVLNLLPSDTDIDISFDVDLINDAPLEVTE